MIGYLKGEILEFDEGKLLLGVGGGERKDLGVVGYTVSVPQNAHAISFLTLGRIIELFVYTHVREEALDLYGFVSKADKNLFLTLLTVNGIGPKSALTILSNGDTAHLIAAIIEGDQTYLTKVQGIGKKTAERVVVELRDSMKKKLESGLFGEVSKSQKLASGNPSTLRVENSIVNDAKAALFGLGYREAEAQNLLDRALADLDHPPKKVEDLIRSALRQLM